MSSDAAGADSSVLATLLDIEAQEFLLTYWDHKPYLRQGSSDADAASPFQSLLCLEDMDELLEYLHSKVKIGHVCLFCNRTFRSSYLILQ